MLNGGIAKDVAAFADYDWNLGCLDVKAIEQRLRTFIGIEIDVGIGIGIAAEKLANSQRAGGMAGAEQNQIAETVRDEREAAQDEGAHEDFAKFLIFRYQRAQAVVTDFEKFSPFGYAAANQAARARNHRHLAGELSGNVTDDGALAVNSRLYDFHGARKDHEEWDLRVAGLE